MSDSNSVNNEKINRAPLKENKLPNVIDEQNNQEVINTFCKDLSKINSLDECGWTPLYRTIIAGDLNASHILITKGANPNIQCSMGETPLYQAVDMCKLDHVKLLIKMGADPNISQDDGLTPLHAAVTRQNILIVKYLLKNGADPNIKTKIYNQSPVHLSIKNNVDPMIMLLLVQFNGSLLDKDKFGKRPIDYICSKEMGEAIEKLKFDNNPNKKLVLLPFFQTPKKYKNWAISKVYSNTIRSNSSFGDLNHKSNTVLKEPGNFKNIFLGTNGIDRYPKINSSKKIGNIRNKKIVKESSNNDNDNDIEFGKENCDPNINKRKLSFTIKEESSCNDSDKGDNNSLNERMSIKNSIIIKNKNKLYQSITGDDSLSNIIFHSKKINIGRNNYEIIEKSKSIKNNNCNKIPKNKSYIKIINDNNNNFPKNIPNNSTKNKYNNYKFVHINGNSKEKNLFSVNPKKEKYNKILSLDTKDYKEEGKFQTNNYLYTKPILSLNELNSKKNNVIHYKNTFNYFNFKLNNKNNHTDKNNTKNNTITNQKNNEIKRVFTFMDNENINIINNQEECNQPDIKNKLNKSRNPNKDMFLENLSDCERKTLSLSNRNTNRNNTSSLYDYSTINLSKFKTIEDEKNFHKKKFSGNTSATTCSYNIELNNLNPLYPIYDWLKEIKLEKYYHLFIDKKIYNLDKIIYNLRNGICNITKKDILKIGVTIPGHIYRIIIKMEIDSEKINSQINNFLLGKKYISDSGEINVLKNSVIYCCGCCSVNNQSNYYSNNDIKKYQLESWLSRIKMMNYKINFIENGFDFFEYFILQMFSSIPIDDNILKDELEIKSINDRDIILLQISKDIKYIIQKTTQFNNNIHRNEIIIKNQFKKEERKTEKSHNCIVF